MAATSHAVISILRSNPLLKLLRQSIACLDDPLEDADSLEVEDADDEDGVADAVDGDAEVVVGVEEDAVDDSLREEDEVVDATVSTSVKLPSPLTVGGDVVVIFVRLVLLLLLLLLFFLSSSSQNVPHFLKKSVRSVARMRVSKRVMATLYSGSDKAWKMLLSLE